MIVRPYYLDILKTYRDVPLVKILAGIRRCGKSTILDMLKDDLLGSGIVADHVIHLRYTSEELDEGMTAKQMYQNIKEKMTDSERYYLLLDEVQEVNGWEKAVNSLLEDANTDIYVTGSNSKLMSSEISTYLTGRYISIPVFTLSFAEYLEFKKDSGRAPKELLNEYIRMGGFPIVALGKYFNPRSLHGERPRKVTILSIRIIGFAQKVYHKTVLLRISLAENAVILPEKPRNPVRTSLQRAGGLRFARAIRAARPYSISSPSGA